MKIPTLLKHGLMCYFDLYGFFEFLRRSGNGKGNGNGNPHSHQNQRGNNGFE